MNKNLLIILSILILPICFYYYLNKVESVSAKDNITNQPHIIKFSSDMCGECVKMNKIIKEVYPKYSNKITIITVAVNKQDKNTKDMISKYNVTLIPTLIFINKDNAIVNRTEGSMDAQTFENYLKRLINE